MKKTTKQRQYKSSYKKYVAKFKAEKQLGNVRNGVRMSTYKQYLNDRAQGETNATMIRKQTLLTEANKKKVMKQYEKLRDKKAKLKPGEKAIYDETFWGKTWADPVSGDDYQGLGFHTTLSGLLHDRYGLHFLISSRILGGEKWEDIKGDYGY